MAAHQTMPSSQRTRYSSILKNLALSCFAISAATSFELNRHPASSSSAITKNPLLAGVTTFEPAIPPRPSYISVDNVSQKYPVTLMNKLFSSVPKRENAVQNINLSFGHIMTSSSPTSSSIANTDDGGVILLVGRSASGKSTLLRLLAGMEFPIDGYVSINGHVLDTHSPIGMMPGIPSSWVKMGMPLPLDVVEEKCSRVQPVILQGKPQFDDTLSVMERIVQMALDTVHQCNKESKSVGKEESREEETNTLLQTLAEDFTSLLTLSKDQCSSLPSELSPSGEYLFGIACSCMMSIAPSIQNAIYNDCIIKNGICYPILLFDELFDSEHPSTVEKCSKGIVNLISHGGVVLSATHRPEYFKDIMSRTVTLSGGKVLKDDAQMLFK